jgi:hypothetical protein
MNGLTLLTLELNPSTQRCQPRFLLRILIFKWLTARPHYESFGLKGFIFTMKKIVNYRNDSIVRKITNKKLIKKASMNGIYKASFISGEMH